MPIFSRKGSITLVVLAIGIALIAALIAFKPTPQRAARQSKPPAAVEVLSVQPEAFQISVKSQGNVAPKRQINLVSQVAGKVISVNRGYANGGFFKAGEKLLQVEPADYEFSVVRAQAQLAKAQEQVALEQGRSRQAKREWRELGDNTANALFLRQPQLNSAKASLESAKADVKKAQLDLARTAISAPFPGRIRQTYADVGQYVNPGTPIAQVYSTDVVEIRLPLSDRQAALIDLPQNYDDNTGNAYPSVTLRSVQGDQIYQWQGKIVRTDASVDIQSRMIFAVAEVENPFKSDSEEFRPALNIGLFVEAEISGKTIPNAVRLPKAAVYRGNEVLVLNERDEVSYLRVNLIQSDLENVTAIGLNPGTRVLVSRLPLAIDGMKVIPKESATVAGKNQAEDSIL